MTRPITALLLTAILYGWTAGTAAAEPLKVVYQFNEGLGQAYAGLNNIMNQLKAEEGNEVEIVVVAYGQGVDAYLPDATNAEGDPYADVIAYLQAQGVSFRVCTNTMSSRGLGKDDIVPGVELVTSGVAEILSLQGRQGYAYLRP